MRHILVCLFLVSVTVCLGQGAKDATDASLAGEFAVASALHFDSVQLVRHFKRCPAFRQMEKEIRLFYRMRSYAFAWYDRQGLTEQAGNLYNRVRQLPAERPGAGLPYQAVLDSLMEGETAAGRDDRIRVELLLTSAYFYFAGRAWQGVNAEQSARMQWFVPRKQTDYAAWLQGYASGADTAFAEPVYRQYNLLRSFLDRYRELVQRGRWAPLRLRKNVPLAGDSGLRREVRRRLVLLGDLDSSSEDLPAAIREFQRRTGLVVDGEFGPATARALSVSPAERVRTLLVNMERNRWLPDTVHGDYLAVNIPEFRVHAYHDDSLLWDIKVVVGQAVHQTVVFSGRIRYIVFSPYWNVPVSIYNKEMRPRIARDPRYLAKHHMERYSQGVRQLPGPWNSLGGVKFLFPNSHSIYLHDTPAKGLFGEKKRAFSHGCIRLAEPAKLAGWLLRDEASWDAARIQEAMHAGREKWVDAPGKVRVVIVYFTAWVDRQGRLNFRDDLYGRDRRLAALLGH